LPLNELEIIVAGGAGGIGSEVTRMLAAEGARVVISYRTDVARAAQLYGLAAAIQADLASAADRARLLDAARALYGLVVLTGDPARRAPDETIESAMNRSHEANYRGPILLAREAAERMKAAGTPGSIVLISTMQAAALFPNSTIYAGAKAALVHAARLLAKEFRGPSGIRVNVVSPGIIEAGMAVASIASGKYAHYVEDGTIARYGRPADIARAIRFFLEPDNYTTGQVLCVDGGITL
jgi:3-oxoacyl-[acyl-carrier protein] reductase